MSEKQTMLPDELGHFGQFGGSNYSKSMRPPWTN